MTTSADDNDPVMDAAVAMFRRDGWIDMRALAREAGIGRATLYRRYGDREELLGNVLIRILDRRASIIRETHRGRGLDGVVDAIREYLEHTAGATHVTTLLREHPDTGMRVLTAPDGNFQPYSVATIRSLIRDEIGEDTDVPLDTLAYAIQRLGEAFYMRGNAIGFPADIDAITTIVRKLLT